MGRRRGRAVGERLDIDFIRSGGVAGLYVRRRLTNVVLDDAEVSTWLSDEPPGTTPDEIPPDRFVYEIVFHRGAGIRRIILCESDLDERSRPLVERLAELARAGRESG